MKVIIDFDGINDTSRQEWLLLTLKFMGINFEIKDRSQSIAEYNEDIDAGNEEIERGEFTKASDIKKEFT